MDDDDKKLLAKEMKSWRGYAPVKVPAQTFGLSPRTIQAIEGGRGFMFPKLLRHAMQTIECPPRGDV